MLKKDIKTKGSKRHTERHEVSAAASSSAGQGKIKKLLSSSHHLLVCLIFGPDLTSVYCYCRVTAYISILAGRSLNVCQLGLSRKAEGSHSEWLLPRTGDHSHGNGSRRRARHTELRYIERLLKILSLHLFVL